MQDARDVAEENKKKKHDAFAAIASRRIRLVDRKWPREAECKEHPDFENGHRVNFYHQQIILSPPVLSRDRVALFFFLPREFYAGT